MDFDKDKDLIPEFLKNSINEKNLLSLLVQGFPDQQVYLIGKK